VGKKAPSAPNVLRRACPDDRSFDRGADLHRVNVAVRAMPAQRSPEGPVGRRACSFITTRKDQPGWGGRSTAPGRFSELALGRQNRPEICTVGAQGRLP
jgi:hypothetical protein